MERRSCDLPETVLLWRRYLFLIQKWACKLCVQVVCRPQKSRKQVYIFQPHARSLSWKLVVWKRESSPCATRKGLIAQGAQYWNQFRGQFLEYPFLQSVWAWDLMCFQFQQQLSYASSLSCVLSLSYGTLDIKEVSSLVNTPQIPFRRILALSRAAE